MNIFEYEDFPSHVKLYFKETLDKFGLKMNLALNSIDKPANNFVFLQNENYEVLLDNISAFPYPEVTISIFLLEGVNRYEIDQLQLRKYLELSDEAISNYCQFHQSEYSNFVEFKAPYYGSYKYSIKFCGDLVIKYYSSLLNNEIDKSNLLKMIKTK